MTLTTTYAPDLDAGFSTYDSLTDLLSEGYSDDLRVTISTWSADESMGDPVTESTTIGALRTAVEYRDRAVTVRAVSYGYVVETPTAAGDVEVVDADLVEVPERTMGDLVAGDSITILSRPQVLDHVAHNPCDGDCADWAIEHTAHTRIQFTGPDGVRRVWTYRSDILAD